MKLFQDFTETKMSSVVKVDTLSKIKLLSYVDCVQRAVLCIIGTTMIIIKCMKY